MLATLTRTDVEDIVASAVLAPSVLNTQPWLFTAHGDVIELRGDPRRTLPIADPDGRSLTISCGAALFNLRLAVLAHRREPVVRLLPDAAHPWLLASVRAAGRRAPAPEEQALHAAIPRRRTNRVPFAAERPAEASLTRLVQAAEQEGAVLRVLARHETPEAVEALHDADRVQRLDDELRAEVRQWTAREGKADGLSTASLGPRARDPRAATRDFDLGNWLPDRPDADFERQPTLVALYTRGDSPARWMQAGQALQRVLLTATLEGLGCQPLTQAVEVPGLRWLLRHPGMGPAVPQVLLRVGYADPLTPPSPRRPVGDVLSFDGSSLGTAFGT